MRQHITKNGGILAGFALVTTGMIAITYHVTQPRIAEAQERQLLSVLNQLVPESMHTNDMHLDCIIINDQPALGSTTPKRVFRARQQSRNVAAIIETTAPDGYSGAIDMVVAVSVDGRSLGARVVNHKETPGLGDKIDLRVSDWILSFNDVPLTDQNQSRWQVKKDGGQFDQFTGATITPRAVVEAIRSTVAYAQDNIDMIYASTSNCLTSRNQDSETLLPSPPPLPDMPENNVGQSL